MQIVNAVDIDPQRDGFIAISLDGSNWDYIAKAQITKFGYVWMPTTIQYKYPSKTIIRIEVHSEVIEMIELQTVTNQPTWSTGTEAGIRAALADLTDWCFGDSKSESIIVSPPYSTFSSSSVNVAAVDVTGDVHTTGAKVVSFNITNPNAYTVFLKIYDQVASPVVGADPIVETIAIPAGSTFSESNNGISKLDILHDMWIDITKFVADSDNTAVVTDCAVRIQYK